LIVGGRGIYCHKTIIACRSTVFKKMILEEERADTRFSEIMVPGITYGVMQYIIRYIYTDSIHASILASFSTLVSLLEAAKILELKTLIFKCEQALSTLHEYTICKTINVNGDTNETNEFYSHSSLSDDLENLLQEQESTFADIRITTEVDNSTIFAHQCIVSSSSEYFKGFLNDQSRRDGMNQTELDKNITTMVLPGTYNDIMRLLHFMYTGITTTKYSSTGDDIKSSHLSVDIQTDIRNAIKFQLPHMKAQCESAVLVTPANSFDVLLFAVDTDSTTLRVTAMNVICQTIKTSSFPDMMFWKKELLSTLSKCPGYIKSELFDKIKDLKGIEAITPKKRKEIAILSLERSRKIKAKVYEAMAKDVVSSGKDAMSMSKAIMLIVLMLGYLLLQNFISIDQTVIFLVNIIVLVCTMLYLFHVIR
jgi:hypothetical protein